MFGVDSTELLVIALVAMVVIGPKDLPRVMRSVGKWVGKARGMANQFKSGVNDMVRDSEIADLEKKWREQNDAIMRANPLGTPDAATPAAETKPESDWGLPPVPAAEPPVATAGDGRRAPATPTDGGFGPVTPTRARGAPPAGVAAPEPIPAEPEPAPARLPPRAPTSVSPARPAPRAPAA